MTRRLGQVELFGKGRLEKGKKKFFGSLPEKIPGNREKRGGGEGSRESSSHSLITHMHNRS